jgi:Zn-dependent protease
MFRTVRIGKVAGVPIGVHWSLLLIGALIAFEVAAGPLATAHPGYADSTYWLAGTAVAVVFFAAVLAHEVAHAVVARRYGVEVEAIDLWALGGMARLANESPTPRAEWRIAVAGPLTSLACGAVFFAGAVASHEAGISLLPAALGWLALTNGLLAAFNLLPAAPLDGGRILSAVIWSRTRDRVRATETSAQVGRTLGWAMVIVGGYLFLKGGDGLFIGLVGWMLVSAAAAEVHGARARAALHGVRVSDVAWFGIARAQDDLDAGTMLWERQRMGPPHLVAVEDRTRRVLGVVTERMLESVPEDHRWSMPLRQLMVPIEKVAHAKGDEPIVLALGRLHPTVPLVGVYDADRLVGMVNLDEVQRRITAGPASAAYVGA